MSASGWHWVIGFLLMLYLSSFVLLAFVRIATGLSVQRLGYLSLKRIVYAFGDGVRLEIRDLAILIHRPTYTRPTWLTLQLGGVRVVNDPTDVWPKESQRHEHSGAPESPQRAESPRSPFSPRAWDVHGKARGFHRIKELLKRIQTRVDWLRFVDLELRDSSLIVKDICLLQLSSCHVAVDIRHRKVERGRLFRHKKVPQKGRRPVEWTLVFKNLLFAREGHESAEVLDTCAINIHGLSQNRATGLSDTSISLKIGRVYVPYDDALASYRQYLEQRTLIFGPTDERSDARATASGHCDEFSGKFPASGNEVSVKPKSLLASFISGVQEIQLAASFIGASCRLNTLPGSDRSVHIILALNEFGIDIFRLEDDSPAHRMYFPNGEMAHQVLLAAISITISLDVGEEKTDRVIYVPLASSTIKTTLPLQTLDYLRGVEREQPCVLIGNLVLTSPSLDLDLKRLPLMQTLISQRKRNTENSLRGPYRWIPTELMPRASLTVSIQEPVSRVVLPRSDPSRTASCNYDMLILSVSSISLEVESLPSEETDLRPALSATVRVSSQHLYYHTAANERATVLLLDSLGIRLQASREPDVSVLLTCNLSMISAHLARPEIINGIGQVLGQVGFKTSAEASVHSVSPLGLALLFKLPTWLSQARVELTTLSLEIAGTDSEVSGNACGIAIRTETCAFAFVSREDTSITTCGRHGQPPTENVLEEDYSGNRHPRSSPVPLGSRLETPKLICRVDGLSLSVVEGASRREQRPLLTAPKTDVTVLAQDLPNGRNCDVNMNTRAILLQYSLHNTYMVLIVVKIIQQILAASNKHDPVQSRRILEQDRKPTTGDIQDDHDSGVSTSVLGKVALVQVKANLPHHPSLLFRSSNLEYKSSQDSTTWLKARLLRLCTVVPNLSTVWQRVILVRNARAEVRTLGTHRANRDSKAPMVDLSSSYFRIAVPHQLVVHQVLDNFVDTSKAIKQLRHRFQLLSDKEDHSARSMKVLPRTSFRSKILLFELEDGIFDWKLGLIYRVGLSEQKQRLARENAFQIKERKVRAHDRYNGSSRYRSRWPGDRPRDAEAVADGVATRTSTRASGPSKHQDLPRPHGSYHMRFDVRETGSITSHTDIDPTSARSKLRKHDALNWRRRIDFASAYQNSAAKDLQSILGSCDESYERLTAGDRILDDPTHPALLSVIISDCHITVDKPSFPLASCATFLHRVGKGMPYDMAYSLLIPTSVQINMGETRATLRNYPLPLLHIPKVNSTQPQRLPSWSLKSDFVIAEESHGVASTREVMVEVVPQSSTGTQGPSNGLRIGIFRTIAPVKTFSEVDIAINTLGPTDITWGTSYQPAIQDMMQVIEKFTKPRSESSQGMGFWDKIRLVFHSRIRVAWTGGGDVHLRLKGSRDPYAVSGHGAGFVMCFRNDVKWDIHQDDDPKKFMTVSCNEHILAIPDYSVHARQLSKDFQHQINSHRQPGQHESKAASFRKVIMKLSGRVRWLAGLVFERTSDGGQPAFDFKRHFDVVFTKPGQPQRSDPLSGFRSDHLHLSLAVIAPVDRDWSISNASPSSGYNSMHTSPRFFTHFFDWWSLFSGVMSLPVRQGKLFAGTAKPSKKFGRHLATIKYNLLLSPFLVSHIYKHGQRMGEAQGSIGVTGLKIRIDSFMLDLHQRREDFAMQGRGQLKTLRTSGMRINQAQLDFISADIRAISAQFNDTLTRPASDQPVPSSPLPPSPRSEDMTDNEGSWIDAHDFVELDESPSSVPPIKTTVMPLAFSPHFTYIRQTDDQSALSQNIERSSHFGHEPTHFCIMSRDNDPRLVQQSLLTRRLAALQVQLEEIERRAGEEELRVVRDGPKDRSIEDRHELLGEFAEATRQSVDFVYDMTQKLWPSQACDKSVEDKGKQHDKNGDADPMLLPLSSTSGFKNCFIIHNAQLKWNNTLRDTVLHYAHQVNQRRGFVYYMSRRAVRFIIDIVEEQQKIRTSSSSTRPSDRSQPSPGLVPDDPGSRSSLEKRINNILSDGKGFVDADDSQDDVDVNKDTAPAALEHVSSEGFAVQDSYHLRLIAPQIQLQSKKSPANVVLVTARETELRVVQIMDRDRLSDDVSGLVQRRFSLDMDGVQFFVTNLKSAKNVVFLEALEPYGASTKSKWPPWAPLETNFDFETVPFGLARVVHQTSASLRYDRYNNLRLKYNSEIAADGSSDPNTARDTESRMDHLWVNFPHVRAICDSSQYYAMYIIVLDLLLYSEPLEKIRNEKLEKIMLAADFSDLSGSSEMVADLQKRIRDLEEIRAQFQLHVEELDESGKKDFSTVEQDLANCEDELFFLMKAITSSQRKHDDRSPNASTNGFLRWYLSASDIVWLMLKDGLDPLVEVQLREAVYERTDNSDGSNHNVMEIEQVRGLNLVPGASYPEMIAPFFEGESPGVKTGEKSIKMFKVRWNMLEAIAGIPVLDQFEINLFPTKLQLEREIGARILDYVFPSRQQDRDMTSKKGTEVAWSGEDDTSDEETLTYQLEAPPLEHTHGLKSSSRFRFSSRRNGKTSAFSKETSTTPQSAKPSTEPRFQESRIGARPSQHASLGGLSRSSSSTKLPSTFSDLNTQSTEDMNSVRWSERDASMSDASAAGTGQDKARRWELHRKNSKDGHTDRSSPSDDLSEMVTRASNFMTLAYVKIPSVVLCLSFKGRKDRNFEDVHNLVFRMPALEYRNKTWSNLDLALRLKKDVVKALISHTGAIIGNKLSQHRPQKQKRDLRDLAASTSMLLEDRNHLGASTPRTSTSSRGRASEAGEGDNVRLSSVASWFSAAPGMRSSALNLGVARPRKGSADDRSSLSTPSFTSLSSSSEQL